MDKLTRKILFDNPDILERYANNDLSMEEVTQVEAILSKDRLLSGAVEGIKLGQKTLGAEKYKSKIKESEQRILADIRAFHANKRRKRLFSYFRISLILIIVALISVGLFFLDSNKQSGNQHELESVLPTNNNPEAIQFNIPPPVRQTLPETPPTPKEEERLSKEIPLLNFSSDAPLPVAETKPAYVYPDTSFWSKRSYESVAFVAILTDSGLEVKTIHNKPLEMLPTIRVSEGDKFLKQENSRLVIPLSKLKAPGPLPGQFNKGKGKS